MRHNTLASCAASLEKNIERLPFSGCWIWMGRLVSGGYGRMYAGRNIRGDYGDMRAHRMSWLIYRGPIPHGLQVCHRCDVRMCVNPAHLFLGTNQDNVDDMMRKGRMVRAAGESRSDAVLSETTIRRVLTRRAWAHVSDPE